MIVIVRWSLVVFKHLINRSNYTAGAAIDHDPSASSYPKVPVSRLDLRRSPLRSIVMDTLSLLSPMRPARVNKIRVGFSQIVCEFHGLNELSNPLQHDRIRRTFSTIYETHQPVHIHANNYGMIFNVDNIPVPDVLEVTYANRNLYKFKPSDDVYPTPLDQPNNPETPDIFLGTFKFA
jgi:hypothetical protein